MYTSPILNSRELLVGDKRLKRLPSKGRSGYAFWLRLLATAIPFAIVSVVIGMGLRRGDSLIWALVWFAAAALWVVLFVLAILCSYKKVKGTGGLWVGLGISGLSLGLLLIWW